MSDATSRSPLILGVDPGGRTTGMVLRRGSQLVWWTLVERAERETLDGYITRVAGKVQAQHLENGPVVAVEGLNHPSPHLGLANVSGLLDTAQMLGALKLAAVMHMWRLREVPPGGHGSAPLQAYPPELVGPRERKAGTGRLRHARSAWDIAGTARFGMAVR